MGRAVALWRGEGGAGWGVLWLSGGVGCAVALWRGEGGAGWGVMWLSGGVRVGRGGA